MSILSRLDGLFAPPAPPQGGVMGVPMQVNPQQDARLAFASALLAGSGASPVRRNLAEIMGQALMAGQAARNQGIGIQQQQAAQQSADAYRQASLEPADLRMARALQADPALKEVYAEMERLGMNTSDPAAIREFKFRQSLSPEQRAEYDRTRWAPPAVVTRDYQGGVAMIDPANRLGNGVVTPISTAQQEATGRATVEAATAQAGAAGRVSGEAGAQAVADLPKVEQTAQQSIQTIDALANHPGLPYITGLASRAPVIPGTDQAGADALAKQVEGQAFLQAFQSLKGGGAITEKEGQAATAAIGRLQRAQKTEEYKSALNELRGIAVRAVEKARKSAERGAQVPGARPGGGEQPKRFKYNPATGRIE